MKRAPTTLRASPGAAAPPRLPSAPFSIDLRRVAAFVDGPLRVITLVIVVLMFVRIFLN
ncbi:hypothetical protein [Muricoccus aerilatus]|uniref:hypothetical protein n=1 Tax=Muricoccus aerilatus TaxID=452982 RepID=UPI000A85E864|nr:hypothetical protein [Roseomonas aerilata]